MWKTKKSSFWMWIAICGFAFTFAIATEAQDLAPDLKKELARIESKLDAAEASIGAVDKSGIELTLNELNDWIKSFMLDAELSEADVIVSRLRKRVKAIADRAASIHKKMSDESARVDESKAAKRADGPTAIKIPVDLKNVSFKRDVAPILASVCVRCHNPMQKSGKFDATTYVNFKEQLEPGDPDSSHVLQLVTGKAEPRMPRGGQTRFSKEWADIWSAWIKQGAKFDGPKTDAPIASYLIDFNSQRREAVAKMPSEELQRLHRETAKRQIEVVRPKRPIRLIESRHLIVHATVDSGDADYIATLGEATVEELAKRFGNERVQTVFRGKLALNVFTDRSDFAAFCQEVDQYRPEPEEYGRVEIRLDDQHAALFVSDIGHELDERVAEFVCMAFLQQLEARKLPPWVTHGYAKTLAASLDSKGGAARKEALAHSARLLAEGKTLQDLLAEKLPWSDLEPMAVSLFSFISQTEKRRLPAFVESVAKTGNVAAAIQSEFGMTPEKLGQSWAASIRGKSVRRR